MGLFDDILKKPQETTPSDTTEQGSTTSGTGGNPPTDDTSITGMPEFMIEKTEEKSLFENPVNESMPTESASISPETPAVSPIINKVEESSPIVPIETGTDSIVINTIEVEPTITVEENMISPETPAPVVTPLESTETSNNDIFAFGNTEESTEKLTENTVKLSSDMEDVLHLREFLSKSIENVDTMVADIDTTHAAKVQEAEWYKKEKERFAELEENTYAEIARLDSEKSQTLHVRELLEAELSGNPKMKTDSDSEKSQNTVETTLTNIAVQNTVTETIKKKTENDSEDEKAAAKKTKKEKASSEDASPIPSLV